MWGAAISAYQTEGSNTNSDWWEWEKNAHVKEQSGKACRHYELYEQDWDLAAKLNLNAIRLSIEWSRIEPRENEFDQQEIGHYAHVLRSLKERNIEAVVTLHHFTNPQWFAKIGGWANPDASFYFCRYAEKIVASLSPYVKFWVSINEPVVYAYYAYLKGRWPPQEKSFIKAWKVMKNFSRSHIGVYRLIKRIYKDKGLSEPSIGPAKHLRGFLVEGGNPFYSLSAKLKDYFFNFRFLDELKKAKALDFIGVNYYTCDFMPAIPKSLLMNTLGWPIYPEGLFLMLLRLKRYHLPVMILENGICTDNDRQRWDFIDAHLSSIKQALLRGIEVRGYFYWSLLDNFEWDKGFGHHFGLIEVDYHTFERRIRESALQFSKEICKNRLP